MDAIATDAVRHEAAAPPALAAPIAHLQKPCDALDWADPDFGRILAEELRRPPAFQRKQWEWVMIYRALEQRGMLRPDARGIVFGAGREPLIFALAGKVGHLLVTDLYDAASPWATARTADPKGFLLQAAHIPVDPARLDVARMDMTAIDHDGPPVDFAYSACSFEHIGRAEEDFVSHLAQVKRILKPGGVYVLTTEMAWGPTMPVPHCFFFCIDDLLGIVARSGLAAEPVFDARLRQVPLNAPTADVAELGVNAPALGRTFVTPWRAGRVFTSAMLVLTNAPQRLPVRVLGYREAQAWVQARRGAMEAALWQDWQPVRLRAPPIAPAEAHEEFAPDAPPPPPGALHSAWFSLPPGRFALRAMAPPEAAGADAEILLRARRLAPPFDQRTLAAATLAGGHAHLAFEAAPGHAHSVLLRGADARMAPWGVFLRRDPPR
jgi:SAM-dependent methyltransferase